MQCLTASKIAEIDQSIALELGGSLPCVSIYYETWGKLRESRDNCILVLPAFSANCHARSSEKDPSKGWWEHMIGPGRPIDTDKFFVICPSLLGGCHGTTGPTSANPKNKEEPYQGDFPLLTIGDLVTVHLLLLDHLQIDSLHGVCGGSMGAMQALELGVHHGHRTKRVVTVSGTDRTRPATAAIRHLGRASIMLDPTFNKGFYGNEVPTEGVKLAREIGTVFYRSKVEFNERFDWKPIAPASLVNPTFDVQAYLAHQGMKIVNSFDANAYLRLSLAMDLHDLSRKKPEPISNRNPVFYVGGVKEDRLMTLDEQIGLHEGLIAAGNQSHFCEFTSPVGHDAFLVIHEEIAAFIGDALLE